MMLVNSGSGPALIDCPHCGREQAMLMPTTGDFAEIKCLTCGLLRFSNTQQAIGEQTRRSAKEAHVRRGDDGVLWLEFAEGGDQD